MRINFKSLFFTVSFVVSLLVNLVFILLLILSGFSKTSSVSFFKPEGYVTAAAVISVPETRSASVDMMSLNLKPGDAAYLQFSIFSGAKKQGKQGNLVFTPLYDPNVVSVSQTGFGLEITALKEGSALIQTLANDGIKDVALVTVSE